MVRDMSGTPVTMENGQLNVPNDPVIHYIEGDGIGVDITPVMIRVVNAAVEKAYGGQKTIVWSEVLAGEKAFNATGEWLPQATLDAMKSGLVSIKGPLTTPVGAGFAHSTSPCGKSSISTPAFVRFAGTTVRHHRFEPHKMWT